LAAQPARQPGGWEGRVWVSSDFEEADDTIAALMLGGDNPV
jgi:hypothetical protein